MNKKVYLAPQTAMVRVLTEGTFAGSVDYEYNAKEGVTTTGHQLNEISGDDTQATWNDSVWQ